MTTGENTLFVPFVDGSDLLSTITDGLPMICKLSRNHQMKKKGFLDKAIEILDSKLI